MPPYPELLIACGMPEIQYLRYQFALSNHHCAPSLYASFIHTPAAENTSYFLDYTQTAFRHFGKRAKYWATFNEPGEHQGHVWCRKAG